MRILSRTCPKCGRSIPDDTMLFCPYCGTGLAVASAPPLQKKKTGFPIAAGVLTIIASCVAITIGIIGFYAFINIFGQNYHYNSNAYTAILLLGIFGVVGFAFGLMGGIFSIKRVHFRLSIIGTSFLLAVGLIVLRAFSLMGIVEGAAQGLLFGLPIILLSILGVIFEAISKDEFTR